MLHFFGECLRSQARASDVVVRYAPFRFLSLLPSTEPAGAWAFVGRVQASFSPGTRLRVGVAEYGPDSASFAALMSRAAQSLRDLTAG